MAGYAASDRLESCDYKLIQELAELLNDHSSNDWKLLASDLNYTTRQINTFKNRDQRQPCLAMLEDWQRFDGSTLYALEESLVGIQRHDAVRLIREILSTYTLCVHSMGLVRVRV